MRLRKKACQYISIKIYYFLVASVLRPAVITGFWFPYKFFNNSWQGFRKCVGNYEKP